MAIPTKLKLTSDAAVDVATDTLVVPLFEGELRKRKAPSKLGPILEALGTSVIQTARKEGFDGRAGQKLVTCSRDKLRAERIVFVGLGENRDKALPAFQDGVGEASRLARSSGDSTLAVVIRSPKGVDAPRTAALAAEAALLGSYRFDRYVSDKPEDPKRPPLKTVKLIVEGIDSASRREIRVAAAVAEATSMARDLVNEPPGSMTPEDLARFARTLAKSHGLKCTIKGRSEIERLRMGLFLGVSLGADTEPKLIKLEYQPRAKTNRKGIALVGKGITFDSGGYDLKPPPGMDAMKMDMAGAATAIATMRAVAEIKPPFPVTCLVGACENLVSGRAYKPGDVLKSRKGTTVEINNTDAEGRLVLADVLTYAAEQGFEAIIDIATLTGACMIALGPLTFGAFSKDDDLVSAVLRAANEAGEDAWRLPINPALSEQLKSDIADIKNTGERMGGAITAALFLSGFVEDIPWVHLDIAGPAMYARDKGPIGKGASGVGVRTLARFIRQKAK